MGDKRAFAGGDSSDSGFHSVSFLQQFDLAYRCHFVHADEVEASPVSTGTSCTANAVDVNLRVRCHVHVDDAGQAGNVQPRAATSVATRTEQLLLAKRTST